MLTSTPRISDTLRRIFSKAIFAKVMKKYHGSALEQVFKVFHMLTVARCSETRFIRLLTNHVFRSL